METEPDKAFFWSGQSDGVHAEDVAQELAHEADGTTLEMRLEETYIPLPPWDKNIPWICSYR